MARKKTGSPNPDNLDTDEIDDTTEGGGEAWREEIEELKAELKELKADKATTAATLKTLEAQLKSLTGKSSDLSAADQQKLAAIQQELTDLKATLAATRPKSQPDPSPQDDADDPPEQKRKAAVPDDPNETPKPAPVKKIRVF